MKQITRRTFSLTILFLSLFSLVACISLKAEDPSPPAEKPSTHRAAPGEIIFSHINSPENGRPRES